MPPGSFDISSAILANQMEKLQDLSQSELEELLDNTERVETIALESDEIQNIQLEREMALASNRSLAEQNLDMRPRLEEQRQSLVERYSLLETARDTYLQHCQLRDGMVGQMSPEALFSRLQTEGANTEAESEALADSFLEGSMPLDSFLEGFLSLRCLAHRRRVRIDKLQELLRQRSQEPCDPPPPSSSSSMTSSTGGGSQDPASPWGHQTSGAGEQQQQPHPAAPYPASSPSHHPAPPSAASRFPPYPGGPAYSGPRPAFGPQAPPSCPYPTQPTFPAPHPGSAFGQYAPQPGAVGPPYPAAPQQGAAPYPASYSYGGYSYPAAPNNQSPTGRPAYGAGY